MSTQMNNLKDWIGHSEARNDRVTAVPAAALAATLDRADSAPSSGDPLPPLWHWLYFLSLAPQSQIGADGHPKRGGFLPPVTQPRRMWAGGRLQFHRPLKVGDPVSRVSRIVGIDAKQGRTGELVFVKVQHEISDLGGVAITEEQDIVYRDHPAPNTPPVRGRAAPASATWSREVRADEVTLFRYSALTFNSHRIHYDRPYATAVEGYPALVVHGPLIATLLLDALHRNMPAAQVEHFEFRAVSPLFDDAPLFLCGQVEADGRTVRLWAKNAQGELAMEATASLR
jgi:3-methylfumaryl-CoA hydratase